MAGIRRTEAGVIPGLLGEVLDGMDESGGEL
jgi:hypothetical protein